MKYVSIDIETAGIGKDCSLLEFGAVIDDLANPKPIESLPKFHTYILNDRIIGEPYALGMHKTIFDRIAKKESPYRYENPSNLDNVFYKFLEGNGYKPEGGKISIIVAGKNFAMFDAHWLIPLFKTVNVNHRVIDPAMLYFKLGDASLPNSKECMKRAKIDGEVAHNAADDAVMVVKLLRKHYYH